MQFLLLIYDHETRWVEKGYDQAEMKEYENFGKEFAGSIKGGNALEPTPTAQTVRVRNGKTMLTDGPFAETKEQLAGFYLVEAATPAAAAAIAGRIPAARYGSIEVRPVKKFE